MSFISQSYHQTLAEGERRAFPCLSMEKVTKPKSISIRDEMLQEVLCEQTTLCPQVLQDRAFGVCL